MLDMHAGTAQFHNLSAPGFKCRQIEFLTTLIAQIRGRGRTGLQSVGAHDQTAARILNQQVVTDVIKGIGVASCGVGLLQALVHFEVEDDKAQGLRGMKVGQTGRETNTIIMLSLTAGQDPASDREIGFHGRDHGSPHLIGVH